MEDLIIHVFEYTTAPEDGYVIHNGKLTADSQGGLSYRGNFTNGQQISNLEIVIGTEESPRIRFSLSKQRGRQTSYKGQETKGAITASASIKQNFRHRNGQPIYDYQVEVYFEENGLDYPIPGYLANMAGC